MKRRQNKLYLSSLSRKITKNTNLLQNKIPNEIVPKFPKNISNMASESVLENVQSLCLRNIFMEIIPLIDFIYKERILKTI